MSAPDTVCRGRPPGWVKASAASAIGAGRDGYAIGVLQAVVAGPFHAGSLQVAPLPLETHSPCTWSIGLPELALSGFVPYQRMISRPPCAFAVLRCDTGHISAGRTENPPDPCGTGDGRPWTPPDTLRGPSAEEPRGWCLSPDEFCDGDRERGGSLSSRHRIRGKGKCVAESFRGWRAESYRRGGHGEDRRPAGRGGV